MKATGIVRRIDDLGRVVIPKEIRRTMRIREGDPLEIYTNSEGEVIFRKYSAIGEMSENAGSVAEIMTKLAGCPVLIFDKDHVVASSGAPRREFRYPLPSRVCRTGSSSRVRARNTCPDSRRASAWGELRSRRAYFFFSGRL